MPKKKKMRSMNDIMLDMEVLLQEMCDPEGQNLQWYEVLGLCHAYLQSHASHAQEQYVDGSRAVYYYGHKDGIK